MRLTRCFVPPPLHSGARVALPAETAAHVVRVLRLRVGAALTVFDGAGGEYAAQIADISRERVHLGIGAHDSVERESPLQVTLLQGLARGERMDTSIQKATELGVTRLIPFAAERSVVKLDAATWERRLGHWSGVTIAACEQCGRTRLPLLTPATDLAAACAALQAPAGEQPQVRLLLDPEADAALPSVLTTALDQGVSAFALLIGPEGGLSANEGELAQRHGFHGCRLGPRVLRTETAPLAALAVLQALGGDLRA